MYQYKKKERETRVLLLLQVETDGQIGLALSRGGGQICHTGEPVVMMKKGESLNHFPNIFSLYFFKTPVELLIGYLIFL